MAGPAREAKRPTWLQLAPFAWTVTTALLGVIAWHLSASGWRSLTPSDRMAAIEMKLDRVVRATEATAKWMCVNATPEEMRYLGVDCSAILRGDYFDRRPTSLALAPLDGLPPADAPAAPLPSSGRPLYFVRPDERAPWPVRLAVDPTPRESDE